MIKRKLVVYAIGLSVLVSQICYSEARPQGVTLIQLIEKPQEFSGRLLRVTGFLRIEAQPRHSPLFILYLSKEDAASHATNKGILVVPSRQMLQDQQQIDSKYVSLTGTFQAPPGPGGSYGRIIKNIKDFVWSDSHLGTADR